MQISAISNANYLNVNSSKRTNNIDHSKKDTDLFQNAKSIDDIYNKICKEYPDVTFRLVDKTSELQFYQG